MIRAAFLDRDGVINRKAAEGKYITRWEDVQFLPGVADAIALLRNAGFYVVVVSNQRCVAKSLLTTTELDSLHQRMCAELAAAGAIVDAVYYCPHDKQPPCECRKPKPGLILDAARIHDVRLGTSWMIGDSDSDVEAGKTAGCSTVRIWNGSEISNSTSDLWAHSLLDAAQKIIRSLPSDASLPAATTTNDDFL